MGFVRLKGPLHDGALLQEVGQPGHDDGVEHVDLEVELVSDVEAVKRHALDEGDPGHVSRIVIELIAAVAHGKGLVDGEVQAVDVCADCC